MKPEGRRPRAEYRVLSPIPYIADPRSVTDAADLMARFGEEAGVEAATRADRSRDRGNAIRFCHWRQVERLVVLLSVRGPVGTVH